MKIRILALACLVTTNLFAAGFLPIANVTKVKGKATINKEQIKSGSEIVAGVEISIPKKNDSVEIKFQNGHIVRLTGAEVKVGEFTPKTAQLELSKGKISTMLTLTPDETFVIKTAHGEFNFHNGKSSLATTAKATRLEVRAGSVTVKNAAGEKEVTKGQKINFKN